MASSSASPGEPSSLEKHITCSICMDLFEEPVTTVCGHSFCKNCVTKTFHINDSMCPLCKTHLSKTPDVNIVLRDIVQQVKKTLQKDKVQEILAPGEVVCDVCTEPKMKAEKSCLVCLASYCSTHLENHCSTGRLKGHKLVEPVAKLDDRACLKHGRSLELYSRRQQTCICVSCLDDGQEEVVSTEEEWNSKKAKLEKTKTELQQKIQRRKTKMDEINTALKSCKDELENEWWEIDAVFSAVVAIIEQAQAQVMQPLKDRRQVLEKEAKDLNDELEKEIKELQATISELDDIAVLEDHILFLQKYPSIQDPDSIKDWTEVELDTSLSFGTMRKTITTMMEEIQLKLEMLSSVELKRVPKFTVDVKLDPNSAHQRLVLSDDGKEVKDGGEDKEVDDSPKRFDLFASVLGLNSLTSGKSYWEVEVSNKSGWDLGVARGDAKRKGKLTLNPGNGYWVTVHYQDEEYAAMTAPPRRLQLKAKPKKVGVFVSYDEGLVSFYNVTAQSHIYSFTQCSFTGELYPYFSPHMKQDEKNSEPLVISDGKHCDQNTDKP
ncbi:E3 ubiquitin-protein ligase TRIM39-like [Mugil cephalus]|uniref:E3 ubiquitin-protein ligase TRIM39-like n=1 Tax=Mugil cephalus TaxID=48193 RepID=UPI001FB5A8A0|nr:E3 ubiquitin-protein ligase TRIM39-like [Mugil cephalus]XP_047461387.1 E3 ubiquitin-protein ligase TRIM39-like [Mugil cephalus]